MRVTFGVLGPIAAWDGTGEAVALRGPRHRAVLARLVVARRRVVPVGRLVGDLWPDEPPGDAVGAVRTFVAALRRALEPERAPRAAPRLLVTEGPGYALRAGDDAVDAWRFERELTAAASLPHGEAAARLADALGRWRGPAYADFADAPWAGPERSRLAGLRLLAVERLAEARLALGAAEEVVPELDAHVAEHPWREDAWGLLALALYRAGRQGDALAVLRRARAMLAGRLGVDPGPGLRRLEEDILRQDDRLVAGDGSAADRVWATVAEAYDRTVAPGTRARLESTVGLLRNLAVTGGSGLAAAREHRMAAIGAAEESGDADLTARVIGMYDVPAVWTRVDDPGQAGRVVAAAERAVARLPGGEREAARVRLLATVALESRGSGSERARWAAGEAERVARGLDDPALLAFALNGVFMQSFWRAGLAARRDAIGAELVALAARHDLVTYEVLGRLVRVQALGALGDFAGADRHAGEADRLAERNELPLVGVFTGWYRAMRAAATGAAPVEALEAGYRRAADALAGAGMPGLRDGLLPLALLCVRLTHGQDSAIGDLEGWGPYGPWVRPVLLLGQGRRAAAGTALDRVPDPPRDLMQEALWCLVARAAVALDHREAMRRAAGALAPAAGELAGAGSGMVTLGPVAAYLRDLEAALREGR
ncbi:BTAD domain-containing putative transcriptional regulator [Streptomyces sp. MS19]|uniref:BTAD domain-containing putative transcriptional regulator n=1 Tax=Streptomyces sp. MS19 TaxID=3385972 RepID=UPI0039A17986